MATIGLIDIKMKVDREDWTKGLAAAGKSVGDFTKSLGGSKEEWKAFGTQLAGLDIGPAIAGGAAIAVAAITAVGASLVAATMKGLEFVGMMNKTAKRIGTTVGDFSQLSYAARMTGTDAEALEVGLLKMDKTLGEAANGGQEQAEAFARIGLSAEDLVRMDPSAAFLAISGAVSSLENPFERAAAAAKIFGKGGMALMNTLGAGPERLRELGAEAVRTGEAFNQVDADKVKGANMALKRMWGALDGLTNRLAILLAPAIEKVVTWFTEWATGGTSAGEKIATVMGYLGKAIGFVADLLADLTPIWHAFEMVFAAGAIIILEALQGITDALVYLLNLIPGMNATTKDSFGKTSDSLKKWIKDTAAADVKALGEPPPSKGINEFFAGIAAGAKDAKVATLGVGGATRELSKDFGDMGKKVAELETKLTEQRATFGMSGHDADIYKLKLAGATDAQLANARAISNQITQMEKSAKEKEKLTEDAKKTVEETRTAAEKLEHEKGELSKQFAAGLINQSQFDKAMDKARESAGLGDVTKKAGALELGSKEARSAMLESASRGQMDPQKEVAKNTADSVTAQNKMVGILYRIHDSLGNSLAPTFEF